MQKYSIRPGQQRSFRKRMITFFSIIVFMFFLLVFRVAYLQIVMGDVYSTRSERNRVRLMPIVANRGEIYAFHFKHKLISNKRSFCVTVVPAGLPKDKIQRGRLLANVANLLSMTTNEIDKIIKRKTWDKYTPKLLKADVGYDILTRLSESINRYPGVFWENRPIRIYTLTNTLSHVLGYTGYISRRELRLHAKRGYRNGSIIGKTGIEQVYDHQIRGDEGILEREVNALNRVTDQKIRKQPVHGNPMILTIDAKLQQLAQNAMGKKKGAIIVSKPATGEVLVLLSNPGYNAGLFYWNIEQKELTKLLNNPAKPLFNRAIQAQYPPSSIFKLVTATAGLETGRLKLSDHYICRGGYRLGNRYFKCWSNHGRLDFFGAIKNSCDVYFYRQSLKMGASAILKYARAFGFGKRTGIDLPGESKGFVPTKKWKYKQAGRPWLDGDTLNLAIGQGDILVTPLQINVMTATIYNNGIAYKPYLKKEIRSLYNNRVIQRNTGKKLLFKNNVSARTYGLLKKSMIMVVNGGTGGVAYSPKVLVGGKTGTAENSGKEDHGWFTALAPMNAKNPEDVIAVTVICENGGGGGAVAAPIAACIIRSHFENKTINQTMQRIWKQWAAKPKATD